MFQTSESEIKGDKEEEIDMFTFLFSLMYVTHKG